jgi:TRAP-type C4-dicarboxylate transport system substrate-binding protein
MSKVTKIRWVIAHEPLNLFLRAAKDFERKVNELQKEHEIQVEIMTLSEYATRYNDGVEVTKHDLLDLMEQGKIEMSQLYTSWLAEKYDKDMLMLDLPYLFENHEHAKRVLEGEVGEHLLKSVSEKSNVRGLCFTYCGGFRQLISNKSVSTLEQLVDSTHRSNRNPVAQATLKALGINPLVCELEDLVSNVNAGNCDGGETAYPRIYPLNQNEVTTTVVNTEHSLFLTSMIIRDSFWDTLSPELQDIIKRAAVEAGREERQAAVDDAINARANLLAEGRAVYELTPEERQIAKNKID